MAQDGVWTIGRLLKETKDYFQYKGLDTPRLDAEVLLAHVLGVDRLYLYVHFDQPLERQELARYREAVRRRARREPVAYITGEKEFMGLAFQVTPAVLIPRPETELVVETAVTLLASHPGPLVADLGTGSGAIAVAVLKKLPAARAVAVDASPAALAVAQANARRHGVAQRLEFVAGDFLSPLAGRRFDALLTNPPYIASADMARLPPEVRWEPAAALAGGQDGLDFYCRLAAEGTAYLTSGGYVVCEVGQGQAPAVVRLLRAAGLAVVDVRRDLAGIERVVICRKD